MANTRHFWKGRLLRDARYRSRVAFGESTLFASKPLKHPSKINASPNDEGQIAKLMTHE
jgi:hypothetical protein